MLKIPLNIAAGILFGLSVSGCKTTPLSDSSDSTPHHPINTDTYWSKGQSTQEVSAKLDLTSGVIEFVGSEGKKGFTKSMPFGHIPPGTYKFASIANEELVYQSGANTITMSFSSPSSSLYLPVEGYRIMESMQPTLEVQTSSLPGSTSPLDISPAPPSAQKPANRSIPVVGESIINSADAPTAPRLPTAATVNTNPTNPVINKPTP